MAGERDNDAGIDSLPCRQFSRKRRHDPRLDEFVLGPMTLVAPQGLDHFDVNRWRAGTGPGQRHGQGIADPSHHLVGIHSFVEDDENV